MFGVISFVKVIRGCAGVCICRCVDNCRCTGVEICRCVGVGICRCVGAGVYRFGDGIKVILDN